MESKEKGVKGPHIGRNPKLNTNSIAASRFWFEDLVVNLEAGIRSLRARHRSDQGVGGADGRLDAAGYQDPNDLDRPIEPLDLEVSLHEEVEDEGS